MNKADQSLTPALPFKRQLFILGIDLVLIAVSIIIATLVSMPTNLPEIFLSLVIWFAVVCIFFLTTYFFAGLHRVIWKFAPLNEFIKLGLILTFSDLLALATHASITRGKVDKVSLSTYFSAIIFSLLLVFVHHALLSHRRRLYTHSEKNTRKVMIIGCGDSGNSVIGRLNRESGTQYEAVCFIDDNPAFTGKIVNGIPVIGTREDIADGVKKYNISLIIFAIPSISPDEKAKILEMCVKTGVEVKTLPSISQIISGEFSEAETRNVEIDDLLGREPVDTNIDSVMNYVSGKTVLVTGGGGSIGSELSRQIASHNPGSLIIFDIYENNAYDIQNELKRNFPELNLVTLIGSVRDSSRIDLILEKYRPDIIYHAAAHKHVPLMEDSPNEAIKNNVLGTYKLAKAADKHNVKRFVLISTDKAVNPTNIMGATKRICEMIVQTFNNHSECDYVAVRFGNVLGSNGSVIPLFKNQIENGGPVTVTHPDIIRYFMTIPEAVSLVLQAGAFAKGGEIFVLDMGKPVKILDLAKNLITLMGHVPNGDIKIEFTGLRPGEKLYEELLMAEEGLTATENKRIKIGHQIDFDENDLISTIDKLVEVMYDDCADVRSLVKKLVPTYKYKEEK